MLNREEEFLNTKLVGAITESIVGVDTWILVFDFK
jgi:hypothetical protein